MYLIKAGSLTIYDSRDKVTYPVTKPVFGGELNAAGTLSFTIFPSHPHYNDLKKMQTFITAYRDDEEIFYGRILTTDKGLDGRMEVTCEGGLTFFLDTEIAKQETTETIDSFLRKCIASHNAQVEAAKQFTVGTIAPESQYASGSYPFDVTSYTVTKNALESLVLNRFGGFLRIRPGNNGIHYVDYITNYGRANTQQIRIGVNIEDKNDRVSGENIFTVLRPIAHASGSEEDITISSLSQSDVTIPNVMKNGDTLELTDKIAIYGKIVHTEDFSDPTTPLEVLRKAEAYITRHGTQLQSSVDISFVDFYHLNKSIPVVKLGDTFTNIEGFEGYAMTVAEISVDMENPANDTITLKNAEELNANRTDSFGNRNGGGSSSNMSSKMSSKNSQDAFRYKYIHENQDQLILATKNIEINASEKFSSLSNKIFLTVEDKEGSPGELVLKATKGNDKVDGAEVILTFDNVVLHKGSSKMDLDGYTTDAELKVERDRITAEVERATAEGEELSARLTVQADAITQEVSRATDAEGQLSSRLQVTADNITAVTGRVNTVEGKVSTIEGSSLWINRDSITGVTGKMEVDENDNLIIKDGAGFRARYGNAEYGIYNENNLTAGIIVDKINGGTTTIQGNHVNINANTDFTSVVGDVASHGSRISQTENQIALKVAKGDVATQLSVECGNVTVSGGNLVVDGYITTTGLNALLGNFQGGISAKSVTGGNITASNNFYIGNSLVSSHGVSFGGGPLKFSYLTTATADAAVNASDLPHYHTVSFSDGKVTIGGVTDTAPGPFDITATTWYKNKIAAARPHSLSAITLTGSDTGSSVSKEVTVFCEDDEEYDLTTTVDASAVYTAGRNNVGLEVDAEDGVVRTKNGSSTKSVTIQAGDTALNYNTSTHKYSTTHEAYAGSALMAAVYKATGTEAYDAGFIAGQASSPPTVPTGLSSITLTSSDTGSSVKKTVTVFCDNDEEYDLTATINASAVFTAGKNAMGVVANADSQQVTVTASSTKSLTISATAGITYSTSTHKYTATGKAKAGSTEMHTASAVSGTEAYDAGVTAGKNTMGVAANADTQKVSVTASSTKSLTISATAGITYSTSTHKYTATGKAKAGSTEMHTASAVSGTEAYDAGYLAGWNAAVGKITRSGNVISGPKTSTGSSYTTETKYTANYTASTYTASSYTKESHSYTASTYVPETHSYTPSSYTKETTAYLTATVLATPSSHSHTGAWIRQDSGSRIYYDTTLNLSGDHSVTFDCGSDSYTPETTSTIGYNKITAGSSYTASKHSYTASVYDSETHSYTASKYTASKYTASSLTWS